MRSKAARLGWMLGVVTLGAPAATSVSTTWARGAGGGDGASPVEVEAHTTVAHTTLDRGVLTLSTNLRAACGSPCDDEDHDGLSDAWEDVVLRRLRPFVRLDEAEPSLGDAAAVVGRVSRSGEHILVTMMLGYARDHGRCGVSAHAGDSERVALELELVGDGSVILRRAYTAAHEGAPTDRGRIFSGGDLAMLTYEPDPTEADEPRWVVFASEGKHATYGSIMLCESASAWPCLEEDCAPDGVPDVAPFTLLMPYANAGEPDAPLVADLGAIGFPGDDAWARQDFCGGLGGTDCAGPVRNKLLDNPF